MLDESIRKQKKLEQIFELDHEHISTRILDAAQLRLDVLAVELGILRAQVQAETEGQSRALAMEEYHLGMLGLAEMSGIIWVFTRREENLVCPSKNYR